MKKIIAVLLTGLVFLSFGGCKPKKAEKKTTTKKEAVRNMSGEKSIEGKEGLFAVINTDKGEIAIELLYKDTPMTVTNFVGLAEGTLDAAKGKPFYDDLRFHRVIADFMIQGGDPLGTGARLQLPAGRHYPREQTGHPWLRKVFPDQRQHACGGCSGRRLPRNPVRCPAV